MADKKRLPRETVFGEWTQRIPRGGGRGEKMLSIFTKLMETRAVPQITVGTRTQTVTLGDFGKSLLLHGRRPEAQRICEIQMEGLRGYTVLIDAQDYGDSLLVSWKLIFDSMRISFIAYMTHGTMFFDAMRLSPTKEQRFAALKTITEETLKEAMRMCMNELTEDYSKEDEKSRGIETIDID